MTRIASIVAVVALLVLGGLWLSQRETADQDAAGTASETAAPSGSATPATAADLDDATLVPALTEERRTSFETPEQVLEPGRDYLAAIDTNRGRIVVDLLEDRAPNTVNNFVFLALNRYYDGIVFHRVLDDFMAQTGDPTGTGRGGPGYQFDDEFADGLTHDRPGILSMANAGPGTNGSQFFITFVPTPWLDGRHAIFGEVIEGLDVLDDLTRIDPSNPSAVALLTDPVSSVIAQGIALEGPEGVSLADKLTAALGAPPVDGQSFTIDGYQGVIGRTGTEQAAGFFPQPDVMTTVTIFTRSN